MDNKLFSDIFTKGLDKVSVPFDNIMVTGDLNYDCFEPSKSKPLIDICDIFDLTNMVKPAICFMKNCNPSLVDVILTNKPRFCFNAVNFGCGISDWHNLIGVVVKGGICLRWCRWHLLGPWIASDRRHQWTCPYKGTGNQIEEACIHECQPQTCSV